MFRHVHLLTLVAGAAGHASLSFPRPRNALDGDLHPWSNWSYPCDSAHFGRDCAITFCSDGKNCVGSCPIAARNGQAGALSAINGQAVTC